VANKDGYAWLAAKNMLKLESETDTRIIQRNTRRGLNNPTESKEVSAKYNILETRFRERKEIEKMDAFKFASEFWDARIFGNTFLESLKDKDDKKAKTEDLEKREHFISTGVVQFGPGISVAPISLIFANLDKKLFYFQYH